MKRMTVHGVEKRKDLTRLIVTGFGVVGVMLGGRLVVFPVTVWFRFRFSLIVETAGCSCSCNEILV